ncbi:MAG: hypothetical protein RLZZ201_846 [Actinomycetota bacterium]|jgi:hypothetical protein
MVEVTLGAPDTKVGATPCTNPDTVRRTTLTSAIVDSGE